MYKLVPNEGQFVLSFLINGVFIYFKTDRYARGCLPGEFWGKIKSFDDFDNWLVLNWKVILFTWITIHIILTILCVMWTTHWPTPSYYSTTSNLYKYAPSTIQIFLSTLIAAIGTFYIRHYDIWINRRNDLWSDSLMSLLDKNSDFFAIYDLLIKEWPFSLLLIFLIWSFFTIFYRIWTIHW